MERRVFFGLSLILIGFLLVVLFVSSQVSKATTITVDDSGGANYTRIQAAINASNLGDTVYVYNGTYNEQITINKTINLTGESNQSTIIKGTDASYSKGIYVTANYVKISNLKIENFDYGAYLDSTANNSTISRNTITNGIWLWGSSNSITDNTITNGDGILLGSGSNNNITFNTLANCSNYGICLSCSENNQITSNIIMNCGGGIYLCGSIDLGYSSHNTISSNTITNCRGDGITVYSQSNTIVSNIIANCGGSGIYLSGNNNNITKNTITNCTDGMYITRGFFSHLYNTITDNNIYGNKQHDIYDMNSETYALGRDICITFVALVILVVLVIAIVFIKLIRKKH